MKFKGTKGEWTTKKTKKGHVKISGIDWEDFCKVYTTTDGVMDTREVTKANAKLIAAAPDLLEALQETNIDLNILKTNFIQIEKVDSRAEGMIETIEKWIDRNNKAIEKALK